MSEEEKKEEAPPAPTKIEQTIEKLKGAPRQAYIEIGSELEKRQAYAKMNREAQRQRNEEEKAKLKTIKEQQEREFNEFRVREKYRQKQRNIQEKYERKKAAERAKAGQSRIHSIGGSLFNTIDKFTGKKKHPPRHKKKGKKARGKTSKRYTPAQTKKIRRFLARLDA